MFAKASKLTSRVSGFVWRESARRPAVCSLVAASKSTLAAAVDEVVEFPDSAEESKPVLLNSKEHAVGYLSKVLNARVYDAAIETELQHAKNLSAVS